MSLQPPERRLVTEATLADYIGENPTIVTEAAAAATSALYTGVRVVKGTLTDLATPRPAWPGVVDWWVAGENDTPVHIAGGDVITQVAEVAVPWSPVTDLPGLQAWYSPADAGAADGATLTGWPDLSGNGNNLTTVTGTPIYDADGLNGTPAVRFNGASAVARTVLVETSGEGPLTFAWSSKFDDTGGASMFWGGILGGVGASVYTGRNGTGKWTFRRFDASLGTVDADTAPHAFVAVMDGANSRLYIDGAEVLTATLKTTAFDGFEIGRARIDATAYGLTGVVGDLVWAKLVANTQTVADLTDWLRARAGLA